MTRTRRTTEESGIAGAFAGETVTRRRLMTGTVHVAGAVAASAVALPVLGFAAGPVFDRLPTMWQPIGPPHDLPADTFVPVVIRLTPDAIGDVAKTTAFVRRRNPQVDTEPPDEWNRFVAISSRCVHVGCPVGYKDAARAFVCPCHGGVCDFRGLRTGGPPPRPLDRFFTRMRDGIVRAGAAVQRQRPAPALLAARPRRGARRHRPLPLPPTRLDRALPDGVAGAPAREPAPPGRHGWSVAKVKVSDLV
jgi:Rieske Fe-S protein